jgi:predicted N-acetyltransferase YhbS
MNQYEDHEYYKLKVIAALADHVGEPKAIGMSDLTEKVFGQPCADPYNDPNARRLRKLIDALQKEGREICSRVHKEGGGYYLSAAASQYQKNINRLKTAGLKKLAKAARMEKIGLPKLLNQLALEASGEGA